jgi:hypothetical protein
MVKDLYRNIFANLVISAVGEHRLSKGICSQTIYIKKKLLSGIKVEPHLIFACVPLRDKVCKCA